MEFGPSDCRFALFYEEFQTMEDDLLNDPLKKPLNVGFDVQKIPAVEVKSRPFDLLKDPYPRISWKLSANDLWHWPLQLDSGLFG